MVPTEWAPFRAAPVLAQGRAQARRSQALPYALCPISHLLRFSSLAPHRSCTFKTVSIRLKVDKPQHPKVSKSYVAKYFVGPESY